MHLSCLRWFNHWVSIFRPHFMFGTGWMNWEYVFTYVSFLYQLEIACDACMFKWFIYAIPCAHGMPFNFHDLQLHFYWPKFIVCLYTPFNTSNPLSLFHSMLHLHWSCHIGIEYHHFHWRYSICPCFSKCYWCTHPTHHLNSNFFKYRYNSLVPRFQDPSTKTLCHFVIYTITFLKSLEKSFAPFILDVFDKGFNCTCSQLR